MGKGSRAVSCLCCPCRCLACGLFSCLCSILVTLVVIVGIAVLVCYLIFRPHVIQATVDSAALSQFSLTQNSSLQYGLALNITVRNPNKRLGIYYDNVESLALYADQRFGYTPLDSFYQGTEATTQVAPQFHGQQPLLGDVAAGNFRQEASDGRFNVDVKLNAKLRIKVWAFKVPGPKTKIDCPLALPAPGNGTAAFQPTKCKVWF